MEPLIISIFPFIFSYSSHLRIKDTPYRNLYRGWSLLQ